MSADFRQDCPAVVIVLPTWIGISKLKSSAAAAFQPSSEDRTMRSVHSPPRDESQTIVLHHVQSISSFLYETVQVNNRLANCSFTFMSYFSFKLCVHDMAECSWIVQWRQLVER